MKLSPLLLTSALIAPATIFMGATAPVAFGITAVLGLSSIALADYAAPNKNLPAPVNAQSLRTETHQLAA